MAKSNATPYGVVRNSILNTSNYFHVTEDLCPDIMHDILEGCAQYELQELLKSLIDQQFLTLNYVNDCILSFMYMGTDLANKPTPITSSSSDHSVKQKG